MNRLTQLAMKRRQNVLATLALSILVAIGPCGAARADVKMAVGAPITGPDATFGAQLKMGAEQAVAEINAAGGILGQKVSIETGDDAADPKQGVSVANKFVGDQVAFVIGHFNSGVTMPASDVYAENGILEITPGSTNPKITDRGIETLFRTCGRDDQQAAVAAKFLAGLGPKKIAILHDKTTYGKGLADETKKSLNALGVTEVLYEGVNKGEKDYSAIVSKLKESGADIVYWGGVHTEGGLLLRQMRDQGVNAVMMSGDGIASDEFAAIAGPGVEGTFMTFPPDPRDRPEAARVVEEFKAKNFNPETYTLYSYAAVEVLKQAAEAAKSLDPLEVAKTIHSGMTFKTVIGDIKFDKKGDVTRADYVVFVWKKGPDGRISYYQLKQ
ncbi:branched-chain amino acid ABC transporter substrate-binding protein [Methylocella tundrae]|uniref:Leucine transporter subunit periplasmic-binding component of ABC superfamily n=1 Tax=Methylocella tundrae TaxID=227605 RepID=A0A4U8Z0V4_METTU|nr:branched-chain amino acid ABC transporter substrate-binding protein [Methylocella tundrae]WPP06231.1 branched-chain amino acid ABC transporter substrate-binding protein [Methylocella tundrae]VFU08899.1 leucine transporter subunit; periplasmic-binding component of ABC superfamily [Methylocella tundrae]